MDGGKDTQHARERLRGRDIAYRAGVSQATVSRALRGDPSVSENTRKRVEAVARALNYRVDKNASSLRCQRSNTIAVLFFEDLSPDPSQINPFFMTIAGSIARACANRRYDLLMSFQTFAQDWNEEYEDCGRADGLILLGYGDFVTYRERLQRLADQGSRFVCWGQYQAGQPCVTVGSDNYGGGREATAHLIALGRRRIAFLGVCSNHYPEFGERYRGYRDALAAAGIAPSPDLQVDALSTEMHGAEAARRLLASGVSFDAVFAGSDFVATGALRVLQEAGIDIPSAVSIVGFDDMAVACHVTPQLTTVAQDTWLAGERLVEVLLRQLKGEPADSVVLPTKLIVRRSTAPKT
jgi:DNA-binding LacI/PurR family transcriptional regulator